MTRGRAGKDGVGMSPQTIEPVRRGLRSARGPKGAGQVLSVLLKRVSEHRHEARVCRWR